MQQALSPTVCQQSVRNPQSMRTSRKKNTSAQLEALELSLRDSYYFKIFLVERSIGLENQL